MITERVIRLWTYKRARDVMGSFDPEQTPAMHSAMTELRKNWPLISRDYGPLYAICDRSKNVFVEGQTY